MPKKGDLVAIVRYCNVVNANADSIDVEDVDDGVKMRVSGTQVLENIKSASEFTKQEKKPLMELAAIVSSSLNTPITVCFDKQDGTERVLVGRITKSEPILGRSYAEDLTLPKTEHRLRQIDHRTIKYAIVNGVKYVTKK